MLSAGTHPGMLLGVGTSGAAAVRMVGSELQEAAGFTPEREESSFLDGLRSSNRLGETRALAVDIALPELSKSTGCRRKLLLFVPLDELRRFDFFLSVGEPMTSPTISRPSKDPAKLTNILMLLLH